MKGATQGSRAGVVQQGCPSGAYLLVVVFMWR
jgi:hypothetical protein